MMSVFRTFKANTDVMNSHKVILMVFTLTSHPVTMSLPQSLNESMLSKLFYHPRGLSFLTIFCFPGLSIYYLTRFLLESQSTPGVATHSYRCKKIKSLACHFWIIYLFLFTAKPRLFSHLEAKT